MDHLNSEGLFLKLGVKHLKNILTTIK